MEFLGLSREQLERLVAKGVELAGRAKTAHEYGASLRPTIAILELLNRHETAEQKQARLDAILDEIGITDHASVPGGDS